MEWIQRNPKKAAGLAGLLVLVVLVLVWGANHGSGTPRGTASLGTVPPAPATTDPVPAFPSASPSAAGSSTLSNAMAGFPSTGMGSLAGMSGTGFDSGLTPHHLVITAGSDGPLAGVGWRIPTADGARSGKDTSRSSSFRHETTVYGRPDYAQLYTFDGPNSSRVWCTVTVDGKVTDHQEARGPWGQVFCQG